MELIDKEVDFASYCMRCIYKKTPETDEPCDTCLLNWNRPYSKKPLMFKENDTKNERK